MQIEIVSESMSDRVKNFEHELKRVYSTGYIIKTLNIKKYENRGSVKGVELIVDGRVSKNQIKQIVSYINKMYNFEVFFFAKSYSIKVWYADSK